MFILILTAARQKAWVTKQAQSVLFVSGLLTRVSWVWPWQRSGKTGHYSKSCVSKKAESFPWITLEKGQEKTWTEKIGLFNPQKVSHYSGNERGGCYGENGRGLTQQSCIRASLLSFHIFSWALHMLQTSVSVSAVPRKHSHTPSSDGPRPGRTVCCVYGSQSGSARWGAHVCLSLFPFHSEAQPSETCKLPLLPSELYPSTNRSTPYGFLLPVVIYVWLLTEFLDLCDTSKYLGLLHTQSQLRPVILLVSHNLDL